ncbi:hypothetical protein SG34_013830 [Thalassomonas viridans]|uniref:Uncharacterized protein n=1 Tax=Thalassomonas viridans TaxID=137584 RepID=A0AAE9Z7A7_9GAMM|nr:hypothetical protein [Thalassomonas viridans]WDE07863.1 hypothetical protein SG34_013830 [Thalassomonas viridans]
MTQEKKGTEEKQDELEVQSVGVSLDEIEDVAGGVASAIDAIDGRDGYTNCCNGCD